MTGSYTPGRGFVSDPRLAMAQALMQSGASTAPVQSPMEGLARALQGGVGGWVAGNAKRAVGEGMKAALAAMQDPATPEDQRFAAGARAYTEKDPFGQNPIEIMQMQSMLDALKQKAPIKLGQTDRLINPNTGKEMVSAQAETFEPYVENGVQVGQRNTRTNKIDYMPAGLNDKWESEVRGGISGQINRRTGEWKPADMRPTTTVNNDMKLPAQQTKIEEYYGKVYGEMEDAARSANQMNARLDRLGNLLEQVHTGKFTGTTLELKRMLKSWGFDLDALGIKDDVAPAEAGRHLANEIALQLRNPTGGAGMPGALSDQDRQFLLSMVPGLETTPEGRKLMLETMKKLNQRAIDVARRARDYLQNNNNRLEPRFLNELQTWADANPLFPRAADDHQPGPAGGRKIDIPDNAQKPSAAPGPKEGDIVDGYRFKGGRPNDPASWELTR